MGHENLWIHILMIRPFCNCKILYLVLCQKKTIYLFHSLNKFLDPVIQDKDIFGILQYEIELQ